MQRLRGFAHLGIWVGGKVPTVGEDGHNFNYAVLSDNVVTTLPTGANQRARYILEGDATYKGANFFPDGRIDVNFGAATFSVTINVLANSQPAITDDFGDAAPMLPDGTGGFRPVAVDDDLAIAFEGTISGNTFTGTPSIGFARGFFADFVVDDGTGNLVEDITSASFDIRFYDAPGYDSTMADPTEAAGVLEIIDGTDELHMGFLGRCSTNCGRE